MKRLLALTALSLLAACSESEPATGRYWYPLPECPDHDLAACDTLTTDCQERLLALAACMYDVEQMPRVPIEVVTEKELVERLETLPDDEPSEEDAELAYAEQALIQLELAQEGDLTGDESTEKLVERLEGVYLGAEQGILIVDRGAPRDDADAGAVLLHELVHALQDAEYGLDDFRAKLPPTEDALIAGRSVIEGQATYLHFRALLAMGGRDVERIDWPLSLEVYKSDVLSVAYEDPSPFLASAVTFPYAYGVSLAYSAWREDGPGFHADQFAKPPLTTYEVMASVEGEGDDQGELDFPTPEGTQDAGLTAIHDTALGAFLVELQLRASGATPANATALARAWRGDRLFIYAAADDRAAWLWQLAFDTEGDAKLFAGRDFGDGVSAESSGARVFVTGGAESPPDVLLQAGRAFLDG